ncbi:signal recognition particle-docking protein FtsY [Candidatus Bathyarchaeota archaeon]|nr:signal recognition particle-docking protein FtsY [Candidatus Bathyarchaeota archaeon]
MLFESLRAKLSELSHRLSSHKLDERSVSGILEEFKMALIEGGVAFDVAEELCSSILERIDGLEFPRLKSKGEVVREVFRESFKEVLSRAGVVDLPRLVRSKASPGRPFVMVFMGINGVGKTTSMAKVAWLLQREGFSVVMACSDTFRTGALEQLVEHGRRLGVKVIRHKYGSDAAAVAFDAINYARAHGINVVLVDTAGRVHTDRNLMEEMRKVVKVTAPDLKVLVLDALTGNDAVEQCRTFSEEVGVDAVFLSKLDADEKGGIAFSVLATLGRPILFIGTGQRYEDIEKFDPDMLVRNLIGG